MTRDRGPISLSRGIPPLECIPVDGLSRLTAVIAGTHRDAAFQYAPLGRYPGDPELREQLAVWHAADASGVFVSNGSLQVLDLVAAHLLRGERRIVHVEVPTYDRALGIFSRHGATLSGIPMERDGMDVVALERRVRERTPSFVYTIPDFQNPTGVTMGQAKRQTLVDLAARYGFPVVEDIPYRELRYRGTAVPSLSRIAGDAAVITIGSLTKVLSPGLRIGYAISDADTSLALALLAENTYLSPPPLCQLVAARCLSSGMHHANISRVREILRPRHDAAASVVRRLLGDALIAVPDGGYFLGVHLPWARSEDELVGAARENGVLLTPGSPFLAPDASPPTGTLFVRLPFQALEPSDFAAAVERLAELAQRQRR